MAQPLDPGFLPWRIGVLRLAGASLALCLALPCRAEPAPVAPEAKGSSGATAFGFEKGMSVEQARAVCELERFGIFMPDQPARSVVDYATQRPPEPMPPLSMYQLYFDGDGLCGVGGLTDPMTGGRALAEAARQLEAALVRRHGRPDTTRQGTTLERVVGWRNPLGPKSSVVLLVSSSRGQGAMVLYLWTERSTCLPGDLPGLGETPAR